MEILLSFWHFITHLNETLPAFIGEHGNLVYALLFAIIFVETGFVVMPFLPGDSLLFVAGSLAAGANPSLNLGYLFILLFSAAVLGDNINYWVGRFFGPRIVKWRTFGRDLVQQKHLDKTHSYFEKYGVKTIIVARFVPIVRTITPFVVKIGAMDYRKKFLPFDIAGRALDQHHAAGLLCLRHTPRIQKHFEVVVVAIVLLSVMPMLIELARNYFGNRSKA
ncbi:MAG: VTT domain-containing protein [Flavobacteriales bacterium]|nr:VTT domain-containing protein [Flavobacteriales bacterium]